MKNSKYFKVETIYQFKCLTYININFESGSLDLELLDNNSIRATDKNGETAIFYFDVEEGKVKTHFANN